MSEAERRAIIEVIDDLQEIDVGTTGLEYMQLNKVINRLLHLLGIGPDYQEDGE